MSRSPLPAIWRTILPAWADRNLRVVLAARVAMSVARAIASVVTALYLAAIGFSAIEIGILFVGVTVASALMSALIGLVADRLGRKPFLVALPLVAAAAAVVYAEVRVTALLFAAAALGSFGRGAGAGAGNVGPYQPAESALVADSVSGERRAAAFGRVAFMSSVGALAGGLLAQVVQTTTRMTPAEATAAYRPAFLIASALSVVAGLLALLLREPPRPAEPPGARRTRLRWPSRSWPALWRFWVTNGTNGALLVPMVLAPTFWTAGAVYVVRMMVQRIGLPLRQSFTQDMADPEERASVAALSNLPAQATMAGGQATAGYLFDDVSLAAPFELAAVLQVANAVLYGVLFSLRPPAKAPTGNEPGDGEPGGGQPGDGQSGSDRSTARAALMTSSTPGENP